MTQRILAVFTNHRVLHKYGSSTMPTKHVREVCDAFNYVHTYEPKVRPIKYMTPAKRTDKKVRLVAEDELPFDVSSTSKQSFLPTKRGAVAATMTDENRRRRA